MEIFGVYGHEIGQVIVSKPVQVSAGILSIFSSSSRNIRLMEDKSIYDQNVPGLVKGSHYRFDQRNC